ncbi:CRISPR system precrRNA processing endoribonuclease RAMP protein Cas6 [Acidithiobacillus caldus]
MSRFWIRARCRDALSLPRFSGSLLRGTFGAALRELACLTGVPNCNGCTLHARCPYALLLETPVLRADSLLPLGSAAPHPWLLEPPEGPRRLAPGETLQFALVLFGQAHAQLHWCLMAFRRAFAKGLGPGRAVLELEAIRREDTTEWSGVDVYEAPAARCLSVPPAPTSLTLHFDTPVRILRRKQILGPDTLGFADFFGSLQRRLGLLETLYEGAEPSPWDYRAAGIEAASCLWEGEALEWVRWERFSHRQHRAMSWAGVTGRYRVARLPSILWPILYRGQWAHVGKSASFGFGRYRLEVDKFTGTDHVHENVHPTLTHLHWRS